MNSTTCFGLIGYHQVDQEYKIMYTIIWRLKPQFPCRSRGPLSVASVHNVYRIIVTLTTTVPALQHSQITLQYPGLLHHVPVLSVDIQNLGEIFISKTTKIWILTVVTASNIKLTHKAIGRPRSNWKQYKKWTWFSKFHLINFFTMLRLSYAQRVNWRLVT